MEDDSRARQLFEELDEFERVDVLNAFAPELARGWIPKPREVEAVIALVVERRTARVEP